MNHRDWLNEEYRAWIHALGSSTVNNFKEHPVIQRMLGNIDPELFKGMFSDWELNAIGCIDDIGYTSKRYGVSGVALRMAYYAKKVLAANPSSIAEIGGGVGEFYAILRSLGYEGTYRIFDLYQVENFQKKYLEEVTRKTMVDMSQTEENSYDYCVSFYALGEFTDATKEYYIKNFIKKIPHGFILWNPHSGASAEVPFECTIKDENPSTYPDNPGLIKELTW